MENFWLKTVVKLNKEQHFVKGFLNYSNMEIWYCIVPRCSVTFWTHPDIIPVGQFFRRWIKSINQAQTFIVNLFVDWLIDDRLTSTWLVYWIRTAWSVFTGAGLKWPNTAGQYRVLVTRKSATLHGCFVQTHNALPKNASYTPPKSRITSLLDSYYLVKLTMNCLTTSPAARMTKTTTVNINSENVGENSSKEN